MPFRLTAPFAADSAAEESDTRAVKQALNRLGYYTPHVQDGITDIPDRAVFAALKAFQKDNGIYPDGRMRPADITARTLDALESAREASDEKYIWRSVRDEKTRPLHADLDGHVFSMNHPSEDGHPGDAPNCRCWMEKVGLIQKVTSVIQESKNIWSNKDFATHFYFGGGQTRTLSEIGLLSPVVEQARQVMFDKVLTQIANTAIRTRKGQFTGSWNRSYPFGEVIFSLGNATIRGRFGGNVQSHGKLLIINAKADYEFSDTFTDPFNVRERKIGSSALEVIPYDPSKPAWAPKNIMAGLLWVDSDYLGTPYDIVGEWKTEITGTISLE